MCAAATGFHALNASACGKLFPQAEGAEDAVKNVLTQIDTEDLAETQNRIAQIDHDELAGQSGGECTRCAAK